MQSSLQQVLFYGRCTIWNVTQLMQNLPDVARPAASPISRDLIQVAPERRLEQDRSHSAIDHDAAAVATQGGTSIDECLALRRPLFASGELLNFGRRFPLARISI